MPAKGVRSEQITRTPAGRWRLRYYDRKGARHSAGVYRTQAETRQDFNDVIRPALDGRPAARRDLTFSGLVDVFLERHAVVAKPRTIAELRWRLKQSEAKFGTVPLVELEGMADEIAGWSVSLSERLRYPLIAALRQALEAGVRYGYLTRNPAKLAGANPMPAPREIRVYTPAEITAIAEELGTVEAAAVRFAAATGLRPSEWASIERRDIDKARRVVLVRGTKTIRSRREVPLTTAALAALDTAPPRLDSRYVFTNREGARGSVSRGRSMWRTSAVVCGDLPSTRPESRSRRGATTSRSTFASNALAAGITTFELARIMGTSAKMIEQHYGTLIDTAHNAILSRLEAAGG
jgi:integrase